MSLTRNLFELCETEAAVWGKASDLRKSSNCFCLVNILVLMTMQAAEMSSLLSLNMERNDQMTG